MLERLFPVAIPARGGWTEPEPIRQVLAVLASHEGISTCAPDRQRTRLCGVSAGADAGTLELATDGARYLLRPRTLSLETFEGHGLTYLRLSARPLGPGLADRPLSLADHNRVRVDEDSAFVWFSEASPLARLTVAPELGTWSSRDLRQYIEELASTMQMQTA